MSNKNIANAFSFLRIIIAPIILLCLAKKSYILAVILLIIGSLSDFLDGYLARKLKIESKFGQIIDSIADKIFSNMILWGIYIYKIQDSIIFFVAMLQSIRDILLLISSAYILFKKLNISIFPSYISKINTTIIFLFATSVIYFEIENFVIPTILNYLCIITLILSIIVYIYRLYKAIKK